MGSADGCDHGRLRRRHPDRQHFHPGAPVGCDRKNGTWISVRLSLTAGQAHDAPAALTLLDRLEPRTIVLGDKAYDADAIRDLIESQGAVPNIPAKSNSKWKPCFSKTLYRERNQVEYFFSKLKHFRRVATRYDKLAENFLAMVKLASSRLWLRANDSTA